MVACVSLDRVPLPPEVQSFFRAIKERPDDDTPRLVFADWLQEHGDSAAAARGEFLRLSVLRHQLSLNDPRYTVLKRREGELLRTYGWDWLGPFADAARAWTFERGMVQLEAHTVTIDSPEVTNWTRTGAAFWIDSLKVRAEVPPPRWSGVEDIAPLTRSALLSHLNRLDLSDHADARGFDLLLRVFRDGRLPFLQQLTLARAQLNSKHVFDLAHCGASGQLTLLDLRRTWLADSDARILAESPYLRNGSLPLLRLEDHRFSPAGIALLRRTFGDRVRL